MNLGPLMLDLRGPGLLPEEREMLLHPLVGGVILFSRNYVDPAQVTELTGLLHALRDPPLLLAVDHEGGLVQRFRDGFTRLPACAAFGRYYERNRSEALLASREIGWLLAAELRAVGVDFSFAPVLDLGLGISQVIRSRAFHADPLVAAILANAFVTGMHAAGMAAVGKHFPGHGSVAPDSHHEIPVDTRDLAEIERADLLPFAILMLDRLDAIMPAHVSYPKVDAAPAGFSQFWLQQIVRERLGFAGVIFSDDLSMAGATVAGDITARVRQALQAGCDMALVCNHPEGAAQVLSEFGSYSQRGHARRLLRMRGRKHWTRTQLLASKRRLHALELLAGDLMQACLAELDNG